VLAVVIDRVTVTRRVMRGVAAVEIGMVVGKAIVEVLVLAAAKMLVTADVLATAKMFTTADVSATAKMLATADVLATAKMFTTADVSAAAEMFTATDVPAAVVMLRECCARCGECHREREQHTPPSSAVRLGRHVFTSCHIQFLCLTDGTQRTL
jgi:hypothetical protein